MLLIDQVVTVKNDRAEAMVEITSSSSFYVEDFGVPAWIGIEYMGQTCATIAGVQLQQGALEPHVGMLLGTRCYQTNQQWFAPGAKLTIRCQQSAAMQGTLASFQCEIFSATEQAIASATLNVYRKPLVNNDD